MMVKDEDENLPLDVATQYGHVGVVELLMREGSVRSGTLHRKTGRQKIWKDRWFVLVCGHLDRYTEENGELRDRTDVRSEKITRHVGGMTVEDSLFDLSVHVVESFMFQGRDFAFQIGRHVLAASSAVCNDSHSDPPFV